MTFLDYQLRRKLRFLTYNLAYALPTYLGFESEMLWFDNLLDLVEFQNQFITFQGSEIYLQTAFWSVQAS